MDNKINQFQNLIFLGSGAMSDAYLTDDGRVLSIGKREDAIFNYQSLYEKLKLLVGKTFSVKTNGNVEVLLPCEDFPFGAMLQSFVPGVELKKMLPELSESQKKSIGVGLAKFASEMQSVSCDNFFNKDNEIKINLEKYEKSLKLIKPFVSEQDYKKLSDLKFEYEKFMNESKFCLTHGDLQEANILIGENKELSGIIDFGNMEYYVPEVELAPMMDYDNTIFESMLEHSTCKLNKNNILLVKLVRHIRHFKHINQADIEQIKFKVNNILQMLEKLS